MVNPPAGGGQPPQPTTNVPIKPAQTTRMGSAVPPQQPTIPYSARKAAALDLRTVERKGDPAVRSPPPRHRPHALPEAPVFRPTEAEFRDPMQYIRSISARANKFGICKIIPPDNWSPDFAIDLEKFHFRTRRQELNCVDGGNRTNLNYLDQLAKFHRQFGSHLNRFPSVDKRPLDLFKLKKAVEVRGGLDKVCRDKKWAEIGRDLGYSGKIMSSLSTSLKNSYQKWLAPYEDYLKLAKATGQPPLLEGDLPPGISSSPADQAAQLASSQPYMSPPNIPAVAAMSHSPAMQATAALHATLDTRPPPLAASPPQPMATELQPQPIAPSSGFTAVNRSGFTTVNSSSGFKPLNTLPPPLVKLESQSHSPQPPSYQPSINGGGFQAVNGTSHPTQVLATSNGDQYFNPLKRTMSHESWNVDSGSEGLAPGEDSTGGRRSKRARKDENGELVNGSHQDSTPSRSRVARTHGEKCEICGKSEDPANILVCDGCDLGYHCLCLDPPLTSIPDYDWQCSRCLVGTGEYGFEEGGIYSLKVFQEKANNFKEHYFSSRMPIDPVTNVPRRATEDDVEREFWRLVENLTESVEVEYGADIHSTTHGSGFPTVEKNPLNLYAKDPWNLNVLPFHEESLFRHIKGDISGMTVPWLYVGMCFSTFCWHNEDHYAYSANYQHFGATKTWYGIPAEDAYRFENAMRDAVPELFEAQPDLLFQLVTILPPDKLVQYGVKVYVLDQRAGEFVVTFPQAYHAGFNHGFNFNEAVNFAPSDWEPFGELGVQRLQQYKKHPCFSHDELLLTAAGSDTTIKTAKWLAPALQRLRYRELSERDRFIHNHKVNPPHDSCVFISPKADLHCNFRVKVENVELQEEDYQCCHCKAFTYLSQFKCNLSGKLSCLLHAEVSDCCGETPQQRLEGRYHEVVLRYSDQELHQLVQKTVDRAAIPETWEARLDKLLDDDSRPPLRTLHTLLTEGEKIPYALRGLDDLGEFVRRCDSWVEEANLYLTRRQQNRRKSEKTWRRSSVKVAKLDEKDGDAQLTLDRMKELLQDGEKLGFQTPQIEGLQEKLNDIDEWRNKAQEVLRGGPASAQELEALLDEGRSFMAVMPELADLETRHLETKWREDAHNARHELPLRTLDECKELLNRAFDLSIPPHDQDTLYFTELIKQGDLWENKAKEVMAMDDVHYPQLEALHKQAESQSFPVNKTTLLEMDGILAKNREAKRQIITLVERSRDAEFRKRPKYTEVRDVVKSLEELNGKPHGTADLEKELKRHEDWMRKGKKLFGKANAPLHILEQHMKSVDETNSFCFDENDTFRPPVEPASREASPDGPVEEAALGEDEKPVFCICRRPEAGLMIECEICHDWYHAKCLKLARGKVKETEKFTCPICDWRVKIPRDAARPKIEDLQAWLDELVDLPFQPEEEDLLRSIVDTAIRFRDFLSQYTHGNQLCRTSEEMPEMLFYLRKLEGAEVLLAHETNIFRQELHKWQPVADQPPPILDQSLSTRKPRPTKQQKLMKEMGVQKIEDLPPHLRTKQYVRRKTTEAFINGMLLPKPSSVGSPTSPSVKPSSDRSSTPVGLPRHPSTGNPPGSGQFGSSFIPDSAQLGRGFPNGPDTPTFPRRTPSPLFSPAHSQPADGLRESLVPGSRGDSAFPIFERHAVGLGLDVDDDLRSGLANVSASASHHSNDHRHDGASPTHQAGDNDFDDDNMFMDMTDIPDPPNEGEDDTAAEPPVVGTLVQDPPTALGVADAASEALELIGAMSGTGADVDEQSRAVDAAVGDVAKDEQGDTSPVAKEFDDFITTEQG